MTLGGIWKPFSTDTEERYSSGGEAKGEEAASAESKEARNAVDLGCGVKLIVNGGISQRRNRKRDMRFNYGLSKPLIVLLVKYNTVCERTQIAYEGVKSGYYSLLFTLY
jgi:hypothetical protein